MADSVCSDPLAGDRWRDIRRLTDRPSGYAVPWFEPGPDVCFCFNSCFYCSDLRLVIKYTLLRCF